MNLIIDFDAISDAGKKDWLLSNLKTMDISYFTSDERQTLEEYNNELEEGSLEIEKGNFVTNEQLKKDVMTW